MRQPVVIVIVVLATACTPGDTDGPTTTSPSTTTTAPTTTTTTIDPAVVAQQTCDGLKVAVFDLDAAVRTGLDDLGIQSEEDLSDAEVGRLVVEVMLAYYDDLRTVAASAPEDVATPLSIVAHSVDRWQPIVAEDDGDQLLDRLDPSSLVTPEVSSAAAAVAQWTSVNCGTEIATDPETVMFTTVFASMFATLGNLFGGLSLFDQDPPVDPSSTALAYGDDPVLDELYEQCGTGDGTACQDLYFSAYGEYELWGQTCGASIPLRPAYLVDCSSKFAGTAQTYGDDFVLDSLWDECEQTDLGSCDALFAAAPFGSDYEQFGASCAGAREGDFTRPCVFVESGEPFTYGDDPAFDELWGTCSAGDAQACDDLFFQTPIGSVYEAFGRVCGDLAETARTCENAAAWLGGPVG
ncbi:MAG: hypothetical protein ACLGHX_03540 [Acidimicrobiia bacterium]